MGDRSLPQAQLRHLAKHFFGRFFDSEAIAAPHTDMHLLFVQILGLLVVPGLLKTYMSIASYSALAHGPLAVRDQAALGDQYFFLCVSMLLTGFITVFEWDALFPDQKDFYNLTPLPLQPRLVFFAKVIALSLFVLLCHIAINGIPTLLFPASVLVGSPVPGSAGSTIRPGDLPRYHLSHAASLFLSSLFVFTSLVSLRALLLLICPAKLVRIVSRSTQLGVLLVLLCAVLSFPAHLITERSSMIFLFPPFWFLGVYQSLLRHHSPEIDALAFMGFKAVAVSVPLSMMAYMAGYRYSMQKGFQSAGTPSYPFSRIRRAWTLVLRKTLLRGSVERAFFHFVAQTAFRRQEHALYWGSFIMIGIALVYSGIYAMRSGSILESAHFNVLLSFSLIMSFFILVGLRFAFSVPADLNANWVFMMVDKQRLEAAYKGACKFMLCAVVIPLLAVLTPCYLVLWSPQVVVFHAVYVLVLSLILIELLLARYKKLPFACSYIPGKANLKLLWPVYVICCVAYSYETTVLERWALQDIGRYAVVIVLAALVFVGLRRSRILFVKTNEIRFEEEPAEQRTILSIEQ